MRTECNRVSSNTIRAQRFVGEARKHHGAKHGMVTLDSFLVDKYLDGMIAREEVVSKAQDPVTVQAKLQELESAQAERLQAA